MEEEILKYNSQFWENIFKVRDWGRWPDTDFVRFVGKNFFKIPKMERKNIKFLELGAGEGANLYFLAKEGFKISALELSSVALKKFKKRLKEENLLNYLEYSIPGDYYYSIEDLPNEYFDVIFDVESLYLNPFLRTKAIIEKVAFKLKKNGYFFSITFSEETWGLCGEEVDYHMVEPKEGPFKGKGFIRYTTLDDIFKLYKNSFLEIINIGYRKRYLNIFDKRQVISEYIIICRKN